MNHCHYEKHPEQLRAIRERVPNDPPSPECGGPINYRNGKLWYCESHGYWHQACNPFGGYEQMENQ